MKAKSRKIGGRIQYKEHKVGAISASRSFSTVELALTIDGRVIQIYVPIESAQDLQKQLNRALRDLGHLPKNN